MCIRDRFKSILARFDVQDVGGTSLEENFWTVADLSGVEQVFEKAKAAERVGFQLVLEQDRIGGLALCFGETDIYAIPVDGMFITGPYLCDKLKALVGAREASVAVLSLKPQLPHLNLDYESPVLDAGVAGYLLNPLKDTRCV